MGPADVTGEWLSGVFGTAVEMTGQERIGDGLVGMNLRVSLRADAGAVPPTVVIKLPSPDETSRTTGIALRNYERESKFYEQIASTVDIHVPRCYHCEWHEESGDFAIILEDLAPAQQGDQVEGCTSDIAERAVLELARLHGPRWGDPTLDDVDWLQRRNADDAAMLQGMAQMFVPNFLATYGGYLGDDGVALVHRFVPRLAEWVNGTQGPGTVTHGDYRLDNLMFATPDGGAPITTVDWQTPGHGPGLVDVAYFLGTSPLPEDRRAIERDLLGQYTGVLRADYGADVDDEWAWNEYRRGAFAGLIMALCASQLVGSSARSEAMFAAMATRSATQVLELESESLI